MGRTVASALVALCPKCGSSDVGAMDDVHNAYACYSCGFIGAPERMLLRITTERLDSCPFDPPEDDEDEEEPRK